MNKYSKTMTTLAIMSILTLSPVNTSALEWFGEDNNVGAADFHWTYVSGEGEGSFSFTYYTHSIKAYAYGLEYKHDWTLSEGVGWAYFPTADFTHLEEDKSVCAGGTWATNYLDPAHDYDDDNSDGCYEEVEVTHTDWETWQHKVKTDKDYYFYNYFTKTSASGSHSGQIAFNHQVSAWLDEWQTLGWDLIDKDSFSFDNGGSNPPPCSGGICPQNVVEPVLFVNQIGQLDINPNGLNRQNVVYSPEIVKELKFENFNAFGNSSLSNNKIFIMDAFKDTNQLEQELELASINSMKVANYLNLDKAYSVITFSNPLSVEELNSFIEDNQISLHQFEGYGVNSQGEKQFLGGISQDQSKLNPELITQTIGEGYDFNGIYSIKAKIPVKSAHKIENNKIVASLDLRGFYLHILNWIHNDINTINAVDYEINDLFWKFN